MASSRDKLKYEFMPSALEITESPASRVSQAVLWILVAFIIAALVWSYFGRVDIIATASGKVVPDGNVKVVQSLAGGVVTQIKAHEGDAIKKGDLLVSLDSTTTEGDVASTERSLATAKLERDVMRKVVNGEDASSVIEASNAPQDVKKDIEALAQSKVSSFQMQRQFASVAVSQASAQLARENINLASAQTNLVSALQNQKSVQAAYDSANSANKPALQTQMAYVNSLVKSANDTVDIMHDRAVAAKTALNQAQASLAQLDGNNGSANLSTVVEQDKAIEQLEADLQKAKKNVEDQSIYAPIDGKLMSFAVNTIGGVVSSGQQLAIVVPTNTPLIIEASLRNQDVGFVSVNQRVAIKVDTFSFQRYGLLEGKVISISPDSIQDEKSGALNYKMRVAVDSNISSKDTTIPLQPGMSITSEVKTGDRRIISFFLDPLIAGLDSSLKTR